MILSKRSYLRFMQESAQKIGFNFSVIENDNLYIVSYKDKNFIMFGIDIGLNNNNVSKIANDKSATSQVLKYYNIPSVEHTFLLDDKNNINKENIFKKAISLFNLYNKSCVLKINNGFNGQHVYKIESEIELIKQMKYLYDLEMNICISPYYSCEKEHRIILLNNQAHLCFTKFKKANDFKHNLSTGLITVDDIEEDKKENIINLAMLSGKALNLTFGSIDILETNQGLKILEINNTVFMDKYLKLRPDKIDIAEKIIQEAFITKIKLLNSME